MTATDLAHGPVAALDERFPVWVSAARRRVAGGRPRGGRRGSRESGAPLVAAGPAAASSARRHAIELAAAPRPLLSPLLSVLPGPAVRGGARPGEGPRPRRAAQPAQGHARALTYPRRSAARLAQLAEHLICNQEVAGSIPAAGSPCRSPSTTSARSRSPCRARRGRGARAREVLRRADRVPRVRARRDDDGLRVPEGVARRGAGGRAGEVRAAEDGGPQVQLARRAAGRDRPRRDGGPGDRGVVDVRAAAGGGRVVDGELRGLRAEPTSRPRAGACARAWAATARRCCSCTGSRRRT